MSNVAEFVYQDMQVRTVTINDEPWFVASDVCKILEHSNTSMAIRSLDDDEKGVSRVYTLGGEQEVAIVNEPGLYSLVLRSNKSEAKAFKRWITHEVIPAIRKHGAYMTPQKIEEVLLNPDTIIQLATQLKHEREARLQLEAKVEADKPKVVFAEALEISKDSILINQLAKLLKQNGIDIGQNRLFEWLRENGYLGKQHGFYNLPTQKSMDMGLFEIQKRIVVKPDGTELVTSTSRVTGKGQLYFINKFKQLQVQTS